RCAVLLKNISCLTLKPLSNTRWESKIEAIRPVRYQLGEIYDALFEISEDECFSNEVQYEAQSLCTKIKDYKFICSLIVWHDLLNRINPVSKQLQEKGLSVTLALKAISNLKTFIEEYKSDINYKSILEKAKELSEEVDGEPQFKTVEEVRRRKKKCHFDYEHADESPRSPEEKF
ncbi:uncharacterized protein LOC118203548, partial [Stegodyphus dumicola]|uniref:uncharacterized protein LOC118203548 n=1 Tax=Stegodyphus dumicola TaxID=202533 RepID=UPI0015B19EF0